MQPAKQTPRSPLSSEPAWGEAMVAVPLADGNFLLDDGRVARRAASCLIVPGLGDKVLVASCRQSEHYIVHLLTRAEPTEAQMNVPGVTQLTITQPSVRIVATEQLALHALKDVDVLSADGTVSITAKNVYSSVRESLVENVRHYIANVEHYLLDVKQVLRLHGKQTSVTADNDVKVDAERISMG